MKDQINSECNTIEMNWRFQAANLESSMSTVDPTDAVNKYSQLLPSANLQDLIVDWQEDG